MVNIRKGLRPDPEAAQAVAVRALTFLAGDPVLMNRFLQMTGIEPSGIRQAATEPSFFAGVLDFVLGHEATLTAFAADAGLAPDSVVAAREALGGSYEAVPR